MRAWLSASLTVAVLVLAGCGPSDEEGKSSTVSGATATIETSPTATAPATRLLPPERDTHRVEAKESARAPGLQGLVDAVEATDFDSVFSQVPYVTARCETIVTRGGDVCGFYGLAPGTDVRWSMANDVQPGRVPVKRQQADFEKLVAGRPASLELIALQDNVRYYLVFALTPRSLSQTPLAVVLIFEPGLATPVIQIDDTGGYGGPPLEFIRYDTHAKLHTYSVLAAEDSFRQREADWAAEMTRANVVLPEDYR